MFLILHGWGGSDAPHWQAWLAAQLQAAGHQVAFPALPHRDSPKLDEWLHTLREELAAAEKTGEALTVVCHSLAVPLWLHHVARTPDTQAHRVLLVAPPGPAAFEQFHTTIGSFAPVPIERQALTDSAGTVRLAYSGGDPYCIEGADRLYGEPLAIPCDRLPDSAGHINTEAGYGPWPAVLEWCLGRSASVTGD